MVKLKWLATALLVLGFAGLSASIPYAVYVSLTGTALWLCAAIDMKDAPLIATNAAMLLAGLGGLLWVAWA